MEKHPEHQKGLVAVLIAAILWSSGGLFIKLISLTPMQISFFRCLVAAIIFAFIFGKRIKNTNSLALLNAVFYASVLIAYVIATKTTTAANAIFLQSTAPIYVLIFEPIINKTRYEKINLITIIVCVAGMFLFFMGKLAPGYLEGNLVALFSGLAFAAFFLGMRKNKPHYQVASIFWGNIIVAIVCVPFLFSIQELRFSDMWMVSFLGVFQIAVAYAFLSFGLIRVLAVEASILSMFEPVLNPVWVYLGYGEVPSTYAIIGGLIIITAIVVRSFIFGAEAINIRMSKKS